MKDATSFNPSNRHEDPRDAVVKALLLGLTTDGAHHKQWAMDTALRALVTESYYAQALANFQWERGIAP